MRAASTSARPGPDPKSRPPGQPPSANPPAGAPPPTEKKDLWAEIIESNLAARAGGGDKPDAHVFIVGAKQGGKSTLVARFLNPDKDEVPKATQGLEYTFARRSAAGNIERKDVAHIWELSGSPTLAEEVAKNKRIFLPLPALATSVVVIVLDLSKPAEVLDTLSFWLARVRERVDACFAALKAKKLPEQLIARAKKQFGVNHEDRDAVRLTGVPIIVVGAKYDTFRDTDAELRKVMARALRYMAHTNGAALLYTSGLAADCGTSGGSDAISRSRERAADKAALTAFRTILNHYTFHTAPHKGAELDHQKRLLVPAGSDRLRDIGRPKGLDAAGSPEAALQEWRAVFSTMFPPPAKSLKSPWVLDAERYAEPDVDALRLQKDAELAAAKKKRELDAQNSQRETTSVPQGARTLSSANTNARRRSEERT